MAETIVRTFSLLKETDRKLEELTRRTFRRNKGDVIDWIVADAFEHLESQNGREAQLNGVTRPLPPLPE